MAAEDPGRPLPTGRLRSRTPIRRLPQKRAAVFQGQRAMRYFLREKAVLRCPAPQALAIAALALRMLVPAPAAVPVALPGEALRLAACRLAAAPGAIDMAVTAAPAEDDLSSAGSAVEPAGGILHRCRKILQQGREQHPSVARQCAGWVLADRAVIRAAAPHAVHFTPTASSRRPRCGRGSASCAAAACPAAAPGTPPAGRVWRSLQALYG